MGFRVRAYDPNGRWLTNGYPSGASSSLKDTALFLPAPPVDGEVDCYMFSNSLPAAVEIEMATLEDRTLQRAESLPNDLREHRRTTGGPFICSSRPASCISSASTWPSRTSTPPPTDENKK